MLPLFIISLICIKRLNAVRHINISRFRFVVMIRSERAFSKACAFTYTTHRRCSRLEAVSDRSPYLARLHAHNDCSLYRSASGLAASLRQRDFKMEGM